MTDNTPEHPDRPPPRPGRFATPPPPPASSPAPPPPTQQQGAQDDVWGVRPPALNDPAQPGDGQQEHGQPGYGAPGDDHTAYGRPGYGQGQDAGHGTPPPGGSQLDRGLSALQRSPLRRDSSAGMIGGICAGIAQQLGVSPAVVRIAAVALALFFGSGIAAYLIAWALLPDDSGRTHVEQGVKGGNTGSIVLLVFAGLSALGMISSLLDGLAWLVPVAVTAALVGYVVYAGKKKKGLDE